MYGNNSDSTTLEARRSLRPFPLESAGPSHRVNPRKGTHACKGCRTAKVRCHGTTGDLPCPRCKDLHIHCYYPPDRRGRPRGSKNRTTLEKESSSASHTQLRTRRAIPVISSEHDERDFDMSETQVQKGDLPYDRRSTSQSTHHSTTAMSLAQDPFNPFSTPGETRNILDEMDQGSPARMSTFRESFPIDRYQNPPDPMEPGDGIDTKNFRGALQAIVQAAARSSVRETQAVPMLPEVPLPHEDAQRFRQWTSTKLQEVINQQKHYYCFPLHGSKRDVARSLDPVEQGLLSESRVIDLFTAFWRYIHPYCSILDPKIHTPTYIRQQSAFLFTVVLAVGAAVLATQDGFAVGQVAEASALHAHAEKLHFVAYTAGAKSIEIVQALMIWADNALSPPTALEDDRWIRLSAMQRMAAEVGLHLTRKDDAAGHQTLEGEQASSVSNDLRTRAWLLIHDTRYFAFHGGFTSDLTHFELGQDDLTQLEAISPYDTGASLPAFYSLNMFQRRMQQRIMEAEKSFDSDLALEAEHTLVDAFLDRWVKQWCPEDGDAVHNWLFRLEASGARLLFHLRILGKRHRSAAADLTSFHKRILRIAESIFEEALAHDHIPHFAFKSGNALFAADIILKMSSRRDLVLRMALRMAGDPNKPTIHSFVRHNGYQMLSMLSSRTTTEIPPQIAPNNEHATMGHAISSDSRSNAEGVVDGSYGSGLNHTNLTEATSMLGAETEFDWNLLFAPPEEPFDLSFAAGQNTQQSIVDFMGLPDNYPIVQNQPMAQSSLSSGPPILGSHSQVAQPVSYDNFDLRPLSQAITERVAVGNLEAGDLQMRILGALEQLMNPARF